MGLDFLREAPAYDDRKETDLANAEWENLGHQVQLIDSDMPTCEDPRMNRDFAIIQSWDTFQRILADTKYGVDVQRDFVRAFRYHVATLYDYGGANTAPTNT